AEVGIGKSSTFYSDQPLIQLNDSTKTQTNVSLGSLDYEFINAADILEAERNIRLQTQKLCGFLNKFEKGLVNKSFKTRWFAFSYNSCKLVCYNSPNDLVPIGDIDISNAVFNLNPQMNLDKPGLFDISTPEKVFTLEARDEETALYWIQELQTQRRLYAENKTLTPPPISTLERENNGLASQPKSITPSEELHGFIPPIEAPIGVVGIGATMTQPKHNNWSLSNLGNELKNTVVSLRNTKQGISDIQGQNVERPSSFQKLKSKLTPRGKSVDNIDVSEPQLGLPEISCQKCNQLQSYVTSLKSDLQEQSDEILAHREMVQVLQKQIDVLVRDKDTQKTILSSPMQSFSDILSQKERLNVELEHLLTATRQENEQNIQKMRCALGEIQALNEQIVMLKEIMQAKDAIVMQLTDKVSTLEQKQRVSTLSSVSTEDGEDALIHLSETLESISKSQVPSVIQPAVPEEPIKIQLDRYKDMCHGYEMQNKLLNKELLELNQLRSYDAARETQLTMKMTETEANFYKIQSKHLTLLKDMETPQRGGSGGDSDDLVSRLLQDAIKSDGRERPQRPSNPSVAEYDDYGFRVLPFDAEDALEVKANSLQRKSEQLANKMKNSEYEQSNQVRWENYMMGQGERQIVRNPELKSLVRGGIYTDYRPKIWKFCTMYHVSRLKQKKGDNYYEKLRRERRGSNRFNPAAKQIELDLLRTLPNNKHYEKLDSAGVPKLRRVLLAYSYHNPLIGYCQGLNRLAAIALLFLSEEDAFWCLVCIVEVLMPVDYFSRTLIAAQVDQRVLKELIADKLPKLASHLEHKEVDLSLFTFNWFLTVFVDNIPVEMFLRIWDAFLYEGSKVLFRFALAFFKYKEDEILQLHDSMAIHRYMRIIGEHMVDSNRIAQIAFNELNPFPMKAIATKRSCYLSQVKMELEELDALREDFKSTQLPLDRQEFYSDEDI
ncbi:unnamed protein product, partial [Owenia fusiformis]